MHASLLSGRGVARQAEEVAQAARVPRQRRASPRDPSPPAGSSSSWADVGERQVQLRSRSRVPPASSASRRSTERASDPALLQARRASTVMASRAPAASVARRLGPRAPRVGASARRASRLRPASAGRGAVVVRRAAGDAGVGARPPEHQQRVGAARGRRCRTACANASSSPECGVAVSRTTARARCATALRGRCAIGAAREIVRFVERRRGPR